MAMINFKHLSNIDNRVRTRGSLQNDQSSDTPNEMNQNRFG
jgi:hypothetical protein